MSRLTSVADYEREIAEIDHLIERLRVDVTTSGSLSLEVELYTLEQRRSELDQEMHSLGDDGMSGHEIDLVFDGGPVRQHRLSSEFMGLILLRVQALVRAMRAGRRTPVAQRGPYPEAIRRETELHFAGSFAGSFGLRLESLDEQIQLDGAATLAPTLQQLISLVEAGDNDDAVLEQLAEIDERSVRKYEDFVKVLSTAVEIAHFRRLKLHTWA